eukprot:PhM_4_TR14272/c3_g2_i4/m.4882
MFGLKGYLLVVDSAGENTFITATSPSDVWLGISDAANEGTWLVTTGPKTGQAAPYTHWDAPSQPDHRASGGKWDDITGNGPVMCEFGGTPNGGQALPYTQWHPGEPSGNADTAFQQHIRKGTRRGNAYVPLSVTPMWRMLAMSHWLLLL